MDRDPIIHGNIGRNYNRSGGYVASVGGVNAGLPPFMLSALVRPKIRPPCLSSTFASATRYFQGIKLGPSRKPPRSYGIEVSDRSARRHFYIAETGAMHRRQFAAEQLFALARRNEQESLETFEVALDVLGSDYLLDLTDCGTAAR